jgi:hypothetical protein
MLFLFVNKKRVLVCSKFVQKSRCFDSFVLGVTELPKRNCTCSKLKIPKILSIKRSKYFILIKHTIRNTSELYELKYLITYLLTPWSRVLLDKLTCPMLIKKFITFYGAVKFLTAFTEACDLFLSWARSIQSMLPHLTFWRSILMSYSYLHLGLPNGLFPSVFSTKTLYVSLLSPPSYVLYASPVAFFSICSPEYVREW